MNNTSKKNPGMPWLGMLLLLGALLSLPGCETTGTPLNLGGSTTPALAPSTRLNEIRKLAVVVPLGGRQEGLETVIETAFVSTLMPKGYDIVTRQSLEQVNRELATVGDSRFDRNVAVNFGKLVNASHILVARMPQFDRVVNRQTRTETYKVYITAQLIEVETGQIKLVVEGKTSPLDNLITWEGGNGGAAAVEKVAKRAAAKIP